MGEGEREGFFHEVIIILTWLGTVFWRSHQVKENKGQ